MLDTSILKQVSDVFAGLENDYTLDVRTDASRAEVAELKAFVNDFVSTSTHLSANFTDTNDAQLSFSLLKGGQPLGITFRGIPNGHEFTSLLLAILNADGKGKNLPDEAISRRIANLKGDIKLQTYVSLTCTNCPDVVQALSLMAIFNPRVRVTVIDGALFPQEIEAREIMGVPAVYLNGQFFASGRMTLEEILQKVDMGAAARDAGKLSSKAPFDVLVIGGGPAGATAAIYAARKGIRTGLVAERFGGQVNDTMEIANYPGVPETNGPAWAAQLEQHVRNYEVDLISAQRVAEVIPADQPGGLITVRLENGGTLQSRTLIVATGARWRNVNVPGEQEYKTKGVAYCPHCDGPLFKGKDVAVIGGGNSGVEAAIDLAGVVRHVTVLEYNPDLKADAVLVSKLKSLPNVTIRTHAQSTEITGSQGKVSGLSFKHRDSGASEHVALQGVFVQIGLVPNTEWLGSVVQRNPMGEIVIDAKGATSAPGIFAAGDCTTVPYKQIVVSAGEGAKVALGAFDYLIRTPAAQ